jgi:hypothetical protein
MFLEVLAESFSQDAHAAAVDDANSGHSGEESAIDEFFYFAGSFVDGASDDVDFRGPGEVADLILQFDGNSAGAGGFDR